MYLETLSRGKVEVASDLIDLDVSVDVASFVRLLTELVAVALALALLNVVHVLQAPPLLAVGFANVVTGLAAPGRRLHAAVAWAAITLRQGIAQRPDDLFALVTDFCNQASKTHDLWRQSYTGKLVGAHDHTVS